MGVRHAASPQQMGRMGGSLFLTSLGPCRGQRAPGGGSRTVEPCEVGRVGEAGSQAPGSLPTPARGRTSPSRRPSSSLWPPCSLASPRRAPGPAEGAIRQKTARQAGGKLKAPEGPLGQTQPGLLSPKITTFNATQHPQSGGVQPSLAACSDGLDAACPRQNIWHKEQPRRPFDALNGHQEAF